MTPTQAIEFANEILKTQATIIEDDNENSAEIIRTVVKMLATVAKGLPATA